jgi:hypothetical protein
LKKLVFKNVTNPEKLKYILLNGFDTPGDIYEDGKNVVVLCSRENFKLF